jgi:hypothetical protein
MRGPSDFMRSKAPSPASQIFSADSFRASAPESAALPAREPSPLLFVFEAMFPPFAV